MHAITSIYVYVNLCMHAHIVKFIDIGIYPYTYIYMYMCSYNFVSKCNWTQVSDYVHMVFQETQTKMRTFILTCACFIGMYGCGGTKIFNKTTKNKMN